MIKGALAGLAGVTGLNATTYLDMAMRARPASSAQDQAVAELARRAGKEIPGEGDERDNRLTALGALAGIAVGAGIGAVGGLLRMPLRKLGPVAGPVVLAAAAMAATDFSLRELAVSDPADWDASAWLSDAVPHLAFGAITWAALK
jgi:hypothetical protein